MNPFFAAGDRLDNELGPRPAATRECAGVPGARCAAMLTVVYVTALSISVAPT